MKLAMYRFLEKILYNIEKSWKERTKNV